MLLLVRDELSARNCSVMIAELVAAGNYVAAFDLAAANAAYWYLRKLRDISRPEVL